MVSQRCNVRSRKYCTALYRTCTACGRLHTTWRQGSEIATVALGHLTKTMLDGPRDIVQAIPDEIQPPANHVSSDVMIHVGMGKWTSYSWVRCSASSYLRYQNIPHPNPVTSLLSTATLQVRVRKADPGRTSITSSSAATDS